MRHRVPIVVLAGSAVALALPGAWAVATSSGPSAAPLPTLPPVETQVEGLYDDEGCLRTAVDEVDCSVRAEDLDAALIDGGVTQTRHLEGFVGSRWLAEPSGTGPSVLPATITERPAATYGAVGLARNDGPVTLGGIEVSARLLDHDGDEVAVVSITSPVRGVRPGEPVPFTLHTSVPVEAVGAVEWSAVAVDGPATVSRALSWTTWWDRPAGGDAVDLYLYRDEGDARPHLLFGSVGSVADAEVAAPEVLAAWLDGDGRVVATSVTPVVGPDGRALGGLGPGAMGDALFVAPDGSPVGAEVLVWAQGA